MKKLIDAHITTFAVMFAVMFALVAFGAVNASIAWLGHREPAVTVKGPGPSGSPGFIEIQQDRCPPGWQANIFSGGSTVEETCSDSAGRYVAIMVPHSKLANYGKDTQAGGGADPTKTIDCQAIPGWPKDRC